MIYLVWLISAFAAVGAGLYVATRIDSNEAKSSVD